MRTILATSRSVLSAATLRETSAYTVNDTVFVCAIVSVCVCVWLWVWVRGCVASFGAFCGYATRNISIYGK
jgi:hypothetical protein